MGMDGGACAGNLVIFVRATNLLYLCKFKEIPVLHAANLTRYNLLFLHANFISNANPVFFELLTTDYYIFINNWSA